MLTHLVNMCLYIVCCTPSTQGLGSDWPYTAICCCRYESIIATLCENLDTLDEPEAKASMIWIIGEYAERIDNADELLEQFLETFPEETSLVQLQLVTATVKLFLKKPTERPQQMIQLVLTYATQETDNPDLRDRAYVYW